jgi:hypothetical protein
MLAVTLTEAGRPRGGAQNPALDLHQAIAGVLELVLFPKGM